ncbi:MAG: hypothetical protein HQ518_22895 [Rhodopirellula sp.]|nr:hypothetical protein [Rhodopirellula sp.]
MNPLILRSRFAATVSDHFLNELPDVARRFLASIARWLIVATAFLTAAGPATADDVPIVRVEEDWRVEIGTPAPEDHAPQIVTVLSPVGNLEREYSVFELNHTTYPNYAAGGMQLQRWYRDWIAGFGSTPQQERLHHNDEVITFTSSMKIENDSLEFQIRNGVSLTWDAFGDNGYLKTQSSTNLRDLNAYSPNVSVANSRVAFASYRVRKLVLTKVRYYSQAGLVSTDDTQRIVHEYSPD